MIHNPTDMNSASTLLINWMPEIHPSNQSGTLFVICSLKASLLKILITENN